jgi:hypothetical protein
MQAPLGIATYLSWSKKYKLTADKQKNCGGSHIVRRIPKV